MGRPEVIASVGQQLGLKVVGTQAFGRYQGDPVAIDAPSVATGIDFRLQVLISRENWTGAMAKLNDKAFMKEAKLHAAGLYLDANTLRVVYSMRTMGLPKPEPLVGALNALAAVAAGAQGPALGERCTTCGAVPTAVFLLNGNLKQLCKTCYDRLAAQFGARKVQEEAAAPKVGRGVLYGLGAAALGGIVWGVVGGLTGYVFGLVSIVIGYAVAWAINKGAGRANNALIVAAVALTLLSVTIGGLVMVMVVAGSMGYGPDRALTVWAILWERDPSAWVIDYLFGLFGVYGAARMMWQTRQAQTAAFNVVS